MWNSHWHEAWSPTLRVNGKFRKLKRGQDNGGYISGVHFQKCSNFSTFFTQILVQKLFHLRRGHKVLGPPKYAPAPCLVCSLVSVFASSTYDLHVDVGVWSDEDTGLWEHTGLTCDQTAVQPTLNKLITITGSLKILYSIFHTYSYNNKLGRSQGELWMTEL